MRFTIIIPDETYKEIQRVRGEEIAKLGKGLSLSKFITQLLQEALKIKKGKLKGL